MDSTYIDTRERRTGVFRSDSVNSFILSTYMLIAFSYYFVGTGMRIAFFAVILSLSGISFLLLSKNRVTPSNAFVNQRVILTSALFVFLFTAVIQGVNGILTPFILYIISAPCLAYFIYVNKFKTKIITFQIYLIFSILALYYFRFRSFETLFYDMSVNYVSVIMIMNVGLLQVIQWRQVEKISMIIPFIAFVFSTLAIGRSGIICSGLLLVNALIVNWKLLGIRKRVTYILLVGIPLLLVMVVKVEIILYVFQNLDMFERFSEKGIASPSRGILMKEYLGNMNLVTLLFGYNYIDNHWFIHYGQNPHNSYIRFHHFFGVLFFPGVLVLAGALFKYIFKKRLFLFIILLAILLRAWTDSVLFLALYDPILILLVFLAFEKNTLPETNKEMDNLACIK